MFAGLLKKGNTRKYRRNSNRSFGLANHNKVKIVSPRRMQCAVNFLISIYYSRDFGYVCPVYKLARKFHNAEMEEGRFERRGKRKTARPHLGEGGSTTTAPM